MRYVSRALLAGGLGLAAAFLVSCGTSSGLLSASENSTLKSELQTADSDITHGDCADADRILNQLQTQIANLPGSTDPTLVSDLNRGAQRVGSLARKQCTGTVAPKPDTTSTPTTTTTITRPKTTSTSSTTSTSTTTTPTNTTPTTPSTPTTPTTPSTPATTPTTSGTTSTGDNGGAGLPPPAAPGAAGNGQGGDGGQGN